MKIEKKKEMTKCSFSVRGGAGARGAKRKWRPFNYENFLTFSNKTETEIINS